MISLPHSNLVPKPSNSFRQSHLSKYTSKLEVKQGKSLEEAVEEGHECIVDISGVGRLKTQRLVDLMIIHYPNKKFLVFAESHLILDEIRSRLLQRLQKDEIAHWKGFGKACPNISLFAGVPPQIACPLCQKHKLINGECPYHEELSKKARIILAPLDYIWLDVIKQTNPDIIVVEENIFKTKPLYPPNVKIMELHGEILGQYLTAKDYYYHAEIIQKMLIKKLREIGENNLNEALEKSREAFERSPLEIGEYLEIQEKLLFRNIDYQGIIDIPVIFPLIEFARENNAQIIITDATFSPKMWELIHVRSFFLERIHLPKPYIIKYEFKEKSPSIIFTYRSYKYAKETLRNIDNLLSIADKIVEIIMQYKGSILILNDGVIPIVTYLEVEEKLKDAIEIRLMSNLPDSIKDKFKVETLHFGNTRSTNKFANYQIGFIVGTYTIGQENFLNSISRIILVDPSKINLKTYKKHPYDVYHYDDELLEFESIRTFLEDYENYQALGRFRLDNPEGIPKVVFWFGNPPKIIRDNYKVHRLKSTTVPRRLKTIKVPLKDIVELTKQFIESYDEDFVPLEEIKENLRECGFHNKQIDKALAKVLPEYNQYIYKRRKYVCKHHRPCEI